MTTEGGCGSHSLWVYKVNHVSEDRASNFACKLTLSCRS